jgi:uncharacterized protein YqhQ
MSKEVEEKIMPVGGQAVIEGVMMRSPKRLATAIRRASGEIEIKVDEYISLTQRRKILNIPVIRGAITLIEVMILGIKTLQWSADKAMEDADEQDKKEGKKVKEKKKAGMSTAGALLTVSLALLIGIGMFFILPLYLTTEIFNIEKEALFLSAKNVQAYSTFHPRCGTSFIVIVMLVSLMFFAILDTLIISFTGNIDLMTRLLTHIPLIPLVGGISYEALKASAKHSGSQIVRLFILPGLALQRITTNQPDDEQVEVAITALKAALGEDYRDELVSEEKPAQVKAVV